MYQTATRGRCCCEGCVCLPLCFCLPRSLFTLARAVCSPSPPRLSHLFLACPGNATEHSRTRTCWLVDSTPSPLPPSDLPNRPLHDACSGCETHSRAPQCRPHQRARAKLTGAARSDPSSARSLGRERKPSATTMHIRLLSGLHISTTSSSRGQRESSTSRLRSLPKSQPTSGS